MIERNGRGGIDLGGVDLVVFDVDDTLYLELEYVRSGFRAVGRWFERARGVDGFDERAWASFARGTRGRVFDDVLAEMGVEASPSVVAEMVEVYRAHDPAIELLRDARECLDRLHGRVRLAAITDGPLLSQRAKAAALGLDRWVDEIVFTEELGAGFGKPDPRSFERIARSTRGSPSRCVYVADNPRKDFLGPRSLGWMTIRVRRAAGLHAGVPSGPDVDLEIPHLEGLGPLDAAADRGARRRDDARAT